MTPYIFFTPFLRLAKICKEQLEMCLICTKFGQLHLARLDRIEQNHLRITGGTNYSTSLLRDVGMHVSLEDSPSYTY